MDVNDYVGIPFAVHGRGAEGLDCWGLVYLIYKQELDTLLPTYVDGYENTEDEKELSNLISGNMGAWREVEEPQKFDAVLMRLKGLPMHVGLMLDESLMVHSLVGVDSVIESTKSIMWRNRVIGYFRHESR